MRLLGFPLEGCTRISPEPALSKAEWARMMKRGSGDDKEGGEVSVLQGFCIRE